MPVITDSTERLARRHAARALAWQRTNTTATNTPSGYLHAAANATARDTTHALLSGDHTTATIYARAYQLLNDSWWRLAARTPHPTRTVNAKEN